MSALVERALSPLDALRRAIMHALLAQPALRAVFSHRETRVPWLLVSYSVLAFALAVFIPSLPILLTPLVLGVPHVVADVRYLVLRRSVPSSFRRVVWSLAAAMVVLRVAYEARLLPFAPLRSEHALGAVWIVVGAMFGARLSSRRAAALAVLMAAIGLGACSLRFPAAFQLVLLHAHNLIAVLIWLVMFRRTLRAAWLPLLLIFAGAAVLVSGALLEVTFRHGVLSVLGLHLFLATDWIAPGLPDRAAVALTTSFAYLQGVHYATWLCAIPQQDTLAQGSTTFRMAWRSFIRDLGGSGAALTCGLALLVLMAGALSPLYTRNLYLSLATFHTWFELALLAFMLARGSAPRVSRLST